jgi:hypothetical protein
MLLKDFENSEKAGAETAVMNHVWTESPKKLGGSKSTFVSSNSSPPSSPARLRTSATKKPQRLSISIADDSLISLPSVHGTVGGHRSPTSPSKVPAESTQRKEHSKKKDTV